jgi:uracil-DNA glycosylase
MLLLNQLLHHIVVNNLNQSIVFIGFCHPAQHVENEFKHVVKYQVDGDVVYSESPFQSYSKYDSPGRILLKHQCNDEILDGANAILSSLEVSISANILRNVQSIVPNDDISLLNLLQQGIRYPLDKYFQVDCNIVNSNVDGSGVSSLGFYPVGRGLSQDGWNTISDKKYMILGHDFGGYKGYRKALLDQAESKNGPTWRKLLALLSKAGIHEDECFFTNAIMGQRREELSSIKNDCWIQEEAFKEDCLAFLQQQLILQQPTAIFVLGKEAIPLLRQLHPILGKLKSSLTYIELDSSPLQAELCAPIEVDYMPNNPLRLVYLVHPSYRHLNVKSRKFNNFVGEDAEVEMLRAVLGDSY